MPTTYAEAFDDTQIERTDIGQQLTVHAVQAEMDRRDAVDNGTFAETLHGKHDQAVAFITEATPIYHAVAHEVGMDWSPDETRERDQRIDAEFRELAACDHDAILAERLRDMATEVQTIGDDLEAGEL